MILWTQKWTNKNICNFNQLLWHLVKSDRILSLIFWFYFYFSNWVLAYFLVGRLASQSQLLINTVQTAPTGDEKLVREKLNQIISERRRSESNDQCNGCHNDLVKIAESFISSIFLSHTWYTVYQKSRPGRPRSTMIFEAYHKPILLEQQHLL